MKSLKNLSSGERQKVVIVYLIIYSSDDLDKKSIFTKWMTFILNPNNVTYQLLFSPSDPLLLEKVQWHDQFLLYQNLTIHPTLGPYYHIQLARERLN